jgi:hypothetical protein
MTVRPARVPNTDPSFLAALGMTEAALGMTEAA